MKTVRKLKGFVAGLVLGVAAVNASAATLSGNTTTDDAFDLYVSTNDSVLGTLVSSGNYWGTTYSFNATLTPNVTNYIHVAAKDVYYVISAFIGDFSLSDNSFEFVNGTQNLLTNTADWGVSASGFGGPYSTPISHGTNGVGPWGFRPGISGSANWIWHNNQCLGCTVYFSTAINPVTAPVPEPETYAMLLAGLGLMGFVARRQKGKTA